MEDREGGYRSVHLSVVGGVCPVEDREGGYRSVHLSVWVGSVRWRTGREATGQCTCQCGWGLSGGGPGRRLPVSTLGNETGINFPDTLSMFLPL